MSTDSMSGSVESPAFEASKKQKGGVSPCSSSGGMTNTSGIWTELKEEGGTARPGESNEREVFMGGGGTERWFKKCSTRDLPYLYASFYDCSNDRLRPSRMARAMIPFSSFARWICTGVPSARKLHQLSLGHVLLDDPASLRVHKVVLVAGHNHDLGNQSRDLSQSVPR
jgi:hypothetical protein